MFQNIQQFHSGGIEYQFLQAFSYIIYNEKPYRYAWTHGVPLAIVFVKVAPYQCYILKFNTLANRFEWQQNW